MRCDGNEPCAACKSHNLTCHYSAPANLSSVETGKQPAELAITACTDKTTETFDTEDLSLELTDTIPVDSVSQQTPHSEASFRMGLGFAHPPSSDLSMVPNNFIGALEPEYLKEMEVSVRESMVGVPDQMPISFENIFSQFPDMAGIGDNWDMPALVCSPLSLDI